MCDATLHIFKGFFITRYIFTPKIFTNKIYFYDVLRPVLNI